MSILLNQEVDTEILKQLGVTLTPNGQLFRTNEQGVLPEIMDSMYKDRTRYKKLALEAKKKIETVLDDKNQVKYLENQISRYNNLQLAKKVTLNSAYGALGNQYFRFFDIRIAEGITTAGQLSIRWIEKKINEYMNNLLKTKDEDYVIASDTDSIYLNMGPLIKKLYPDTSDTKKVIKFMNKVCDDKIQPFIDSSYQGTYAKVVGKILTDYLKVSENNLGGFYEETVGVRDIVIPNLKPLDAIDWCAKRSVDKKQSPNYMFFQNLTGFNFVSLSKLLNCMSNEAGNL